jgi:hypothetical protein
MEVKQLDWQRLTSEESIEFLKISISDMVQSVARRLGQNISKT